jgi:nucleotide-binding universal stress UspA family protein
MTMEPVKRLVVATDFSDDADRALAVAIRFARAFGAEVELVHVYPMAAAGVTSPIPGVVPMPPPGPDILDGIQRALDARAIRVRDAGVECLTANPQGNAADEIVAHANRVAADLIVTGTHGRSGIRKVLLGSVAERVLSKARCPVLVIPPPREAVR